MEVIKRPPYLKMPKGNPYGIKIGNPEAEDQYRHKRYDEIPKTLGEDYWCHCGKRPQTVCPECIEYLCEDHLYRHPKCEVGK